MGTGLAGDRLKRKQVHAVASCDHSDRMVRSRLDTPIMRSAPRYIRSLVSVLEYQYALGAYLLAKSCVR